MTMKGRAATPFTAPCYNVGTMTSAERRAKARAEGKCTICCSQLARKNLLTCQDCSDRAAARAVGMRAAAKNSKNCQRCYVNRAMKGVTMCEACMAYIAERTAERRAELGPGVCVSCMHRKALKGQTRCGVCRRKRQRSEA